jgi:alpha-tubulin suppressor-like RCC1 family protein
MIRRVVLATVVAVGAGVLAAAPAHAVDPPFTGHTSIDAGGAHTCAVMQSRTVRCWGADGVGQVGDGLGAGSTSLPVTVELSGGSPLQSIAQVAAGNEHTCARTTTRNVFCWGDRTHGQLGNATSGAPVAHAVPVVSTSGSGALGAVVQITSGWEHSCARLANTEVRCWGRADRGQMGTGLAAGFASFPGTVVNGAGTAALRGVTQVVAGGFHTCALLTDRTVRCWGTNGVGELGNGASGADRNRPVVVRAPTGNGPLRNVLSLAAGVSHTCARVQGNQVRCWGDNAGAQLGQVGARATTNRSRPVVVRTVAGDALTGVTQLQLGNEHSCARLNTGSVSCWGNDGAGQRGDGPSPNAAGARPVRKAQAGNHDPGGPGNLAGALQVTAGGEHACARVRVSGQTRIQCWGTNAAGQLGTGGGDIPYPRPSSVLADSAQSE